jgi:hypothetical protein
MKDCEYLQKKGAAQGKGIKYDEVIAMLREHLITHGVVMVVNQISMEMVSEVGKQKIYQGHYTMDLVNMDKPDEFVKHSAFAQGMDGGDKGPGKASTYAMKIMLVKGFGIETGEDEESRSEKIEGDELISKDQAAEIIKGLVQTESDTGKFCAHFGVKHITELQARTYKRALSMINAKRSN